MSWQAVLGTEKRFAELAFSPREDFKEGAIPAEYDSLFFNFDISENPQEMILFFEETTGGKYLLRFGDSIIKRLSSFNPSSSDDVVHLIEEPRWEESRSDPERWIQESANSRLAVSCYLHTLPDDEPTEAICKFFVDKDRGGLWCGLFAVYFDSPFDECCQWMRQFEATVKALLPNTGFSNHIGICNDCGLTPLPLKNHGAWSGLCDLCGTKREINAHMANKAARKRQKERIHELNKQRGIVVLVNCCICRREMWRTRSRVEKGPVYCSPFCLSFASSLRMKKRVKYTPGFLRSLMEQTEQVVEHCPFPTCEEKRTPYSCTSNPFRLCKKHAMLLSSVIYRSRKKREAVLRTEGLV